jgi:hypothetical protein
MKKLLICMFAIVAWVACTPNAQTESIPFEVAHNYFVRNDVSSVPVKISTQEMFERYFGMAAFMGKNGEPTPIDFSKQFVIALVLPETAHSTEISVEGLTQEGDCLVLTYQVSAAEKENTWTQVPSLLIIVNCAYERDCVIFSPCFTSVR